MRRSLAVTFAALALTFALAGLAAAQPYPPMPPPQIEGPPLPRPGTRYAWVPGHWQWNGVRYDWRRGHYVLRAAGRREFIPGHWGQRGPTWVWVPDRWR